MKNWYLIIVVTWVYVIYISYMSVRKSNNRNLMFYKKKAVLQIKSSGRTKKNKIIFNVKQ